MNFILTNESKKIKYMIIKINIAIIILMVTQMVLAQKVTISGYAEDEDSGEKLIGCNIYYRKRQL